MESKGREARAYLDSTPVGLSALSVYVPRGTVDLTALSEKRNRDRAPGEKRDFSRSLDSIGQREFRVPEVWEDSVTMAAESTRALALANDVRLSTVTKLLCGTETPEDHSKPVVSYVQGLVEIGGEGIGPDCSVYDLKHGCAGSSYALIAAASEILAESAAGIPSRAIVTAVDTARYEPGTTAELTSGAGAIAVLVERDPKLVRLDPGVVGLSSQSVDDFFRTLGSHYARARGRYSIQCYKDALLGAAQSYVRRAKLAGWSNGGGVREMLGSFDYLVLHSPFASLPVDAARDLLARGAGLDPAQVSREVERLRLADAVSATRLVGNLYTASLMLCLADLLDHEAGRIGAGIEGKRILFGSYGSGNTMLVFGGTVVRGALEAIARIRLGDALEPRRLLGIEEYEERLKLDKSDRETLQAALDRHSAGVPAGAYRIAGIRPDGYRLYGMGA